MVKTTVVKQIEFDNQIFKIGQKVRVLLKSDSEYIGIVKEIFSESFSILVDDEEKNFSTDKVAKLRIAGANENFYNTWNF